MPRFPDKPVCGAKRKRDGQPCQGTPVNGTGRCRIHGGLSPRGPGHKLYKHGRYSKYMKDLPPKIAKGYKDSLADEKVSSLHEELALLTVRMGGLIEKLGETKAPPWGDAVEALNDAMVAKTESARSAAMEKLNEVVRRGEAAAVDQEEIWEKIEALILKRTTVSGQEHRRLIDLQSLIPASDALLVFRAIMETVKDVVMDSVQDRSQASKIVSQVASKVCEMLPGSSPDRVVIENQPPSGEGESGRNIG